MMTANEDNRKRSRLSAVSDDALTNDTHDIELDTDVWFDDGSVVLVAQNVGFRVYRELLAMRSQVFRDLFAVPQPPNGRLVDGCPVVQLSDTSIALKEFLSALLFGKSCTSEDDPNMDRLSYRIRLADKYGVDELLQKSLRRLRQLFPSTLKEWDDLERNANSPWAVTAVNLARLTRTNSVLPSALYSCIRLINSQLLSGVVHSDGTTDVLDMDDLLRCMQAKTSSASALAEWIIDSFRPRDCNNKTACEPICSTLRRDTMHRMRRTGQHAAILARVLSTDHSTPDRLARLASNLCAGCVECASGRVASWRAASWRKMPLLMRIEVEGWDDGVVQ